MSNNNYVRRGQKMLNNMNENRQRHFYPRKNNQNSSIKIIHGNNQGRQPVKILTAKAANQHDAKGRAAKIQENLKHLKIAAQKKKLAQEHYYGQGRSPMVRTASGNFAKQNVVHQQQNNRQQNSRQQNSRQSFQQNNRQNFQRNVRQRLGQVNNNNANTNPNSFTRNANRKQFIPNVKQQKLNRVNQFVNKQQRRNNINPRTQQGNVKVHSLLTGEVRYLRPLGSKPKPARPTNYTVRVDNVKSNNTNNNYRHHAGLNANIQQQIRLIQNKPLVEPNLVTQIVMPQRDTAPTVPIMTTRTTLHERFSMM